MRIRHWSAIVFGAAALLFVACGGGSTAGPDLSPRATSASGPEAGAPEPIPDVPPRTDGLTGAPVPPPQVQSAEFNADRVDARGAAFPPLNDPEIVSASEADWLDPDTLVLGAVQQGAARAYPIFMMAFHHVANDVLGGKPYLVTF